MHLLDTGEPVPLGRVLAKAGEGVIYDVAGRGDLAAKVFHPTLTGLPEKLDKVSAMVSTRPVGAVQPDGFVVLTWPRHVLAENGAPVGYVMPRIDTGTAVEIHTVSNPSNRLDPLPSAPQWTRHATWGHLVNVAANLCLAVEVVHRVDAVIGDFQERNILVADTTQVTLVDCDSMQFTDRSGRRYLCGVGRPEFTAPELAGVNLRVQPRQQPSDLFALAVHIHLLLMAGNHPFLRGTWTGAGQQPDALTLARAGDWAGGASSRLRTHPLAPPTTFLPREIQELFGRAFTGGALEPTARPTAGEWRAALSRIQLATCDRQLHQVPVDCLRCPWCAIDDERQARRSRDAWSRPGTGPQRTVRPTVTGPAPITRKPVAAQNHFGVSTRAIVAGIVAVTVIVVVLAVFIIWAVLSGASSFGAAGHDPAGGVFMAMGSGSGPPGGS